MNDDLNALSREQLIEEIKRLRGGIRERRDATGHDLCWHHPKLWTLLPERLDPEIAVPSWPKFLRGCIHYRESLEQEQPGASVLDAKNQVTASLRRVARTRNKLAAEPSIRAGTSSCLGQLSGGQDP